MGKEDSGKRRQPARNAKSRRARRGNDPKETNIAVVNPATEARGAREDRLTMMIGIWGES